MLPRPRLQLPDWLKDVALGLLALAVLAGAVVVLRGGEEVAPSAPGVPLASAAPTPSADSVVRAVFFGDSIVAGANAGVGNPTFVDVASRRLAWTSSSFGFPGSGFTTAGSFPGGRDYLARIEQLRGYDIEVLVIEGGLNDGRAANATLRKKVTQVLDRAEALLPGTQIVLMGPWAPSGTPTRPAAVVDLTLKELAKERALPFVDPIAEKWITGDDKADGNATTYISDDGLYPNAAGHEYFGQRLADVLERLLPERLLPAA